MAKVNFSDCKYFIYCHYNDYHDLDIIGLQSNLRRFQRARFDRKECGFITGCRNEMELDYIVRELDKIDNIDYVILEQMSLFDYEC